PGIAAPIEEEGNHPWLVVVGRGEEGRGPVGMPRVDEARMRREHPPESGLVTAVDGAEELLDQLGGRVGGRETGRGQRIEMCAELSPAREAVLSRHRELSIGQLRRGIGALEMVEAVLGELLQILEVGTIRQGHGAPSFLVPGVRGVGRKVVMSVRSAGGFNPSRGPSAAWTALFASLLRHGAKSRPGEEDTCFLVLWAPLSFTTRVTGGSGVGGWRRGLLQRQRRSGTPSSRPPLEERRFGR